MANLTNPVFVLTTLTRGAGEGRRTTLGTFDVKVRHVMLLAAATPVAIVLLAAFWPLLGSLAVLLVPLVWGAAFYLFESRTRSGLKLRRYQALADRRNGQKSIGKVFMCGQPVAADRFGTRVMRAAAVPVHVDAQAERERAQEDEDALFGTRSTRVAGQGADRVRLAQALPPLMPESVWDLPASGVRPAEADDFDDLFGDAR